MEPKCLQVKNITEKMCTARGTCVKWRSTLDTYVNPFFPGIDEILAHIRTMTQEISEDEFPEICKELGIDPDLESEWGYARVSRELQIFRESHTGVRGSIGGDRVIRGRWV